MSVELTEVSVPDLVAGVEGGGPEAGAMRAELERRLTDDPDNSAVAKALEGLGPDAGIDDDAAQAGGGGATEGRSQGEQTWLVQRTELIDIEPDDPRVVWVDVGEVSVPPRTKRKTIVAKAIELFPQVTPGQEEKCQFRVLDADSAEEIPVGWEIPPAPAATLRIG